MVFTAPAPPTPVLPAVETIIDGVPGKAIKATPVRLENGMYAVTYDYVDPPGRSIYVAPPPAPREKSNYELVAEAWGTLTRLAPTEAMAAFIVQAVNEVTTRINLEAAEKRQPKRAEQPAPKSEQVARGRRYFKLDD